MSSISSFTLRFIIDRPVSFQSFSGFASCGIFYNLIRSVDECLAEKLHSSKKLAPWASSPLILEYPSRVVYRRLPAPSIARVSFTIMDDKLCEVFKQTILRSQLYVELVNVKAKVIGVSVNTYKFSDLASSSKPLPERFAVRFLTPTAFRRSIYDCCPSCPHYLEYLCAVKRGRRMDEPCKHAVKCMRVVVPLPIPSLMFKNLARLWSAFSKVSLDVWSAARWAENALMIAGFPKPGIWTVRVYEHPTTNKWIVGFMGTVRFAVRREVYDERKAKIATALLRMAEMTNVGLRRTAGFGMIRSFNSLDENHNLAFQTPTGFYMMG
ncbi:MAG: CRISPR system precrRNA processing endoribonuclease RAMP protein Cas6 [Thermosphaera sp.]